MQVTLRWGTEVLYDSSDYYNFDRGAEKGFGWQNVVKPYGDAFARGHWDIGDCNDVGICPYFPDPDFPVEPPNYDYDFSGFLGTDPTGCQILDASGVEIDYDPMCKTVIRLDRGGLPFDVVSFVELGYGIRSSKGGAAGGEWGSRLGGGSSPRRSRLRRTSKPALIANLPRAGEGI